MKHPTQGLATSRAYIVSDNCPWHISSCRTQNDLPLNRNLAVAPYHLQYVSHTYTHIPIRWQLSYFCHCTATVILTEESWECSGIHRVTWFIKGNWWRARGNLSTSSPPSPKGNACLWLWLWVFLMFEDEHRLAEQEMLEVVFVGVRGGDSFQLIRDTYFHFFFLFLFPHRLLVSSHCDMDLIGTTEL